MAYHGYGKVFRGKMDRFAEGVAAMGFPLLGFFAWSAGLSEFLGGLLIVIGLGTRPSALFVFITMGVAAFIRHGADPFSRKELALAYWAMAGAVILWGPDAGRWTPCCAGDFMGKTAARFPDESRAGTDARSRYLFGSFCLFKIPGTLHAIRNYPSCRYGPT